MSDIKIQPSATGSGTVTITAPTTNTARVITLPDGTGTLAFTTGDDDKLPLSGGTMTGNLTVGSSSGGTVLRITAANNNYAYLEMGDPDDVDIGRIVYSNINNRMQIYVNTAEKLRIHSTGIASFNNGITLGSGLDATAANTLDDYEEGTWTMVMTGSSSGSGNVGTGHYTKIGRMVHCMFMIDNAATPTFSGNMQVSLPFTGSSGNTNRNEGSGDCYTYPLSKWTTGSDYTGVTFQVYGNSPTTGNFQLKRTNTDRQSVVNSSQGSNSNQSGVYARFSITYTAA